MRKLLFGFVGVMLLTGCASSAPEETQDSQTASAEPVESEESTLATDFEQAALSGYGLSDWQDACDDSASPAWACNVGAFTEPKAGTVQFVLSTNVLNQPTVFEDAVTAMWTTANLYAGINEVRVVDGDGLQMAWEMCENNVTCAAENGLEFVPR